MSLMIKNNVSLKSYTTFGIDVNAKAFCVLNDTSDLNDLSLIIKNYDRKIFLGSGSNLLFCNDFDGIVIKNNLLGITIKEDFDDKIIISSMSGSLWNDLVKYCVKNKYYGIENLTAIPGTVGAAPVQNIGAYGVELKDVFLSLEGYCFERNNFITFTKDECEFGYRTSIFKKMKDNFLITKVNLILSKKKKFNLEYKSLKNEINKFSENEIDIELISNKITEIRNSKLPDYKILGNAGSFFKNPEVNEEMFNQLINEYPDISYFKTEKGYKISAGWLIEKCGFKGRRVGNVGCYEKQALVIVNYGNATGKEIFNFATQIKNEVYSKFKIILEQEVNIIQ